MTRRAVLKAAASPVVITRAALGMQPQTLVIIDGRPRILTASALERRP